LQGFYIVFLRDPPKDNESSSLSQKHLDILTSLRGKKRDDASEYLIHSYTRNINAFVAKISGDEAAELSEMEEVSSIFPNRYHELHTTKSWDFIGLTPNVSRNPKVEGDIIVGLLDTGVTPESESFKDDGLGPPPSKWKGSCGNFSGCNKKLIGAKYFKLDGEPDPNDILSPTDVEGHGTHTASTMAGAPVSNASLFGFANGTARGGVPSARVAVYKVCWASSGCADMDILAAFDAAISDGVDVVSVSLGGVASGYTSDAISVGSFRAMRKGILTVASAGNSGPNHGTVTNHAPWILTVAASGTGREFRSKVALINGGTVSGVGLNDFDPKKKPYPLASGTDLAINPRAKDQSMYCLQDSMDPQKVKGKLVHCKLSSKGTDAIIKGLGGVGAILESDSFLDVSQIYVAPATHVNTSVGKQVHDYIHSTRNPSAVIYRSEEVTTIPAPYTASFSSRGPNPGSKHILKPDIAAPGINILASYTPLKSVTGFKGDSRHSKFTIMSGTSMACPHVGGVAAYVKSFHPDWSPAAIKSAILTTAKVMSSEVDKDAEFAFGTGQVNPIKAVKPGLVYDMDADSYIQFLCGEGYDGSSIGSLIGRGKINCSEWLPKNGEDAINYPTMQLTLSSNRKQTTGVFLRRVKNVGAKESVYNATIKAPAGVEITVKPSTLVFSASVKNISFEVVVKATPVKNVVISSGSLTWKSAHHSVRSPIVIF
ncbi:hypothetical protein M569_03043, partial [Genlisea aurea]